MTSTIQLLFFAAIAALTALAAYGAYVQRQRRHQELSAAAVQLGWHFDPNETHPAALLEGPFDAFQKGRSQSTYNRLIGAILVDGQPWPAVAGDYQYVTESTNGKHRTEHTHRFSYLIIDTPHLGSPDLLIRHEGMFDRFASFMGFDDIDFESHEFSERFHVKSSNKRFAYAVLEPRTIEFLLDGDPPSFEFRSGRCCLLRGSGLWSGSKVVDTARWAEQFLNLWPAKLPSVLDA